MDHGITGDHAGMLYSNVLSQEISDPATSFSDEQNPGSDVPGGEVLLPESLQSSGGDVGQIQCSGPGTPDPTRRGRHSAELSQVVLEPGLVLEGEAGPDQRK